MHRAEHRTRDEAVRRPWYFSGVSCFITMLNKELQCEIFTFSVIIRIFGFAFYIMWFPCVFLYRNPKSGIIAECVSRDVKFLIQISSYHF